MKTLIIAILIAFFQASDNPDAILGKWNTMDNEGIVKVYKRDQKYFAKLIELKEPNDKNGQQKKDSKIPVLNLKPETLSVY